MDGQLREKAAVSLILALAGNPGSDIQFGASIQSPCVKLMNLQEDAAPQNDALQTTTTLLMRLSLSHATGPKDKLRLRHHHAYATGKTAGHNENRPKRSFFFF